MDELVILTFYGNNKVDILKVVNRCHCHWEYFIKPYGRRNLRLIFFCEILTTHKIDVSLNVDTLDVEMMIFWKLKSIY